MSNEPGKKPVVHTKKHIARLERERRQSRIILYAFIGVLALVLLLIGYGYLDVNFLQARRPVAKVGEAEIISNQFESRVRLQRQQLLIQYSQMQYYQQFGLDVSAQVQQIEASLNAPEAIGESVLEQMINEEIIRQEAAKRGITVSKEEVDKAIEEAYGFFPNGTPVPTATATLVITPTIPASAFSIVTITPTPTVTALATGTPGSVPTTSATVSAGSEAVSVTPASSAEQTTGTPAATATAPPTATFTPTATAEPTATVGPTSTPEPTATPYTLEGFQGEYTNTVEDFAEFGIDEAAYRQFFEMQLLREKLFKEVTKDVQRVQEQVWARHILVADEETAKSVLERLNNGEDFGALAQELSQDPGSGAQGGDLGWFGRGAMVAPFEEVAFTLEPGKISDPVQSDFGYHIIQVIARQERPLSEDEYSQATEQAFSDFLSAAREELGVEIYDFWKQRVPNEPNFVTVATKAAIDASTSQAETASALDAIGTGTPTP